MENKKNGFQFINLNSRNITPNYIQHRLSKPDEVYVAKLEYKKNTNLSFVKDVYKLIFTKEGKLFQKSDGRVLAVKVSKGNAFESIFRFYNGKSLEESLESIGESLESSVSDSEEIDPSWENGIKALETNPVYQNSI
jgi:hypothetical protein